MIPGIAVNNASIYIEDKQILRNINLNISQGEFIYLIGKVGAGKTSFLRTLYADLPLQKGNIVIANFQLKKIQRADIPLLRRKLGIIFQDFQLLTDRTVQKNLSFVLESTGWDKKDIPLQIEKVLTNVGLPGVQHKMPHELSGGQQQKVVIARALLNEPEVILADEPTGNMDPDSANDIMRILNEIKQNGKTILMATHNYSLLKKYPARILRLDAGNVYEIPYHTPDSDVPNLLSL